MEQDKMTNSIENGDVQEYYDDWPSPTTIISDGAYGVGTDAFDGDPGDPNELTEWYRPHVKSWSEHATPETTLWFWCSDIGWANVHPLLEGHGWEYQGVNIWDKGMGHRAGRLATEDLRRFPTVSEFCVHYVRSDESEFSRDDLKYDQREVQQWLRDEWQRADLTFQEANDVCGVVSAASRVYFGTDEAWYFPPPEKFERLRNYANEHGNPDGRPYLSPEDLPHPPEELGTNSTSVTHRAKFDCPMGVTNVWRERIMNRERLVDGTKASHPNQKPIALMERIIRASTDEGDVVWEPFGGLGSATVAAARLDRASYAAEIDEQYVEIARDRLRDVSVVEGVGQQGLNAFAEGDE